MEYQDDRTPEQRKTHQLAWGGTDRFMSGWGRAEGGASFAFWSYQDGDGYRVERWVRHRGDIQRVRQIVLDGYRPKGIGHCHIYVVDADHPARG
jgi:hypothetical protein